MRTPSAWRPAVSRVRGPEADTKTGTGPDGDLRCEPTRRWRPTCASTVSPRQSRRIASMCSTSVDSLALENPSSMRGRSPTPVPQTTRPGPSCSSDRKALAVMPVCLVRGFVTDVPTLKVEVACRARVAYT